MTLSEEELSRFFRIRKTVMEMLSDRGYVVGDFEINMSKNEFLQKYGENKREDFVILKAKRNNDSEQVHSFNNRQFICIAFLLKILIFP